jgi:hypothetical protein
MDQAGNEFLPGFLLAQAGQSVQFRNSEDVLHNVRVTEISSQKPVFNVATVAFGKYEHKFWVLRRDVRHSYDDAREYPRDRVALRHRHGRGRQLHHQQRQAGPIQPNDLCGTHASGAVD